MNGPSIPFDLWSGAMGQQKSRPCKMFHTWRRVWGGADNGSDLLKCGRCGAEWFPPTASSRARSWPSANCAGAPRRLEQP